MGKKKKGKLSNMSDEERARYLQARADIEEESRRRKYQLIALYMKNKLKREDAFTRLNLAKINQEWRTILRQLKCEELRNEIKSAEELCKMSIDRKNAVIHRLLFELEEAEETYSKNLQSHSQTIQKLTDIHEERLKFWFEFYTREKSILLNRFQEDVAKHLQTSDTSKSEVECLFYALEDEIQSDQHKEQSRTQNRHDEFRDMMTIRLEHITKSREAVMDVLWREFQMVLNNYTSYTKEFYDDYLEIRRKDEVETHLNQSHYRELTKCTDEIIDLRLEINCKRNSHQLNKKHLQDVKIELQSRYTKSKAAVSLKLQYDKTAIRDLVICASDAKRVLEKLHKKGTSLSQLTTICRKFESERQNFSSMHRTTERVPLGNANLSAFTQDFQMMTYNNFTKMDQFWDRYNKVRLDCACLIEERSCLNNENNRLKMRLKQYLVDIAMSNSSGANCNQTVRFGGTRPKSMTIEKVECFELSQNKSANKSIVGPEKWSRPVTCIEGNLSVAIRSHRLLEPRATKSAKYSGQIARYFQ